MAYKKNNFRKSNYKKSYTMKSNEQYWEKDINGSNPHIRVAYKNTNPKSKYSMKVVETTYYHRK